MTCSLCNDLAVTDPVYVGRAMGTVHRACFIAWDVIEEAEEREHLGAPGPDIGATWDDLNMLRKAGPDLTGHRFGRLIVLGPVIEESPGRRDRRWRVRCGCGREFLARPANLKRGDSRCAGCRVKALAVRRTRIIGGRSVSEIAQQAGISRKAVWWRLRHGWSLAQLGTPALRASTQKARRAA